MKWLFQFTVYLLLLTACTSNSDSAALDAAIEDIRSVYAPDKRSERFDISWEKNGDQFDLHGHTTSVNAKSALLTTLDTLGLAFSADITVYPDESIGPQKLGIISTSVAHLRAEPKHSSELTTQETMGHVVELFTRDDNWYLTRTPNAYIAWIHADAILPVNETQLNAWKKKPKSVIQTPTGWIYHAPNKNASVLSDFVAGMLLEDLGTAPSGFRKIGLPDGRQGYIQAKMGTAPMPQDSILSYAKKYIGVPYLWGGASAKGFDCSGYTKSIFELHGLVLPRDASQQAAVGKAIPTDKSWSSLRKGDLLFFGSKREDGSDRVTHVAIYLGDGQMIHATGEVKMESLVPDTEGFAKDRYDTFLSARRVLGPDGRDAGVLPFRI